MTRYRALLLRGGAHLAAWLPFLAGAAQLARDGWRPVGDEAAIALRSWSVLTGHGPLVGQATRLAHGAFDPGPLEYWLLAIPVHLDPVHGVLWGALICCLAACSVSVEAARAVRGELAGLCAGGLIAGLLLWLPAVALPPSWNPWFGMVFFTAALASAWAAMSGHPGWWPACVITGSVAAQAHLMFALASGVIVLLALAAGLTGPARAGYRWLIAGLAAAAACWSAPVVQQLTARHGNLAALLRGSTGGSGPQAGLGFGLRGLAAAVQPVPLWWRPVPPAAAIAGLVRDRPAAAGLAALAGVAAAGLAATRPLRCRWLAALAVVTLVLDAAVLVTYAAIPVHHTSLRALGYLIVLLYPAGTLSWLVLACAAVLLAGLAAGRAGWRVPRGAVPGLAAALAVAAVTGLGLWRQPPAARAVAGDPAMRVTLLASGQIERALPGQRIAVSVRGPGRPAVQRISLGLAWALTPSGFQAEMARRLARELGRGYVVHVGTPIPQVTVVVRRQGVAVHVAGQERATAFG